MSNDNLPQKANPTGLSSIDAAKDLLAARILAINPGQYKARVTRKNPCAVVLMLDQSGSMSDEIENYYGETKTKSQALAEVVNEFLEIILMKCLKDGIYRDYFNLLVIGYGNESEDGSGVSIVWEGNLEGKDWVNVNELKSSILRTDSMTKKETLPWGKVKETIKTRKIWINPCDDGPSTPMFHAFQLCKEKVQEWAAAHQESFPPIIFNITDGQPTDVDDLEDLGNICNEIKSISTIDGSALLFNCLIADQEETRLPALDEREILEGDDYHLALFDGSSILPQNMKKLAYETFDHDEKYNTKEIKGVIINSSMSSLVKLLNIGTNTNETID